MLTVTRREFALLAGGALVVRKAGAQEGEMYGLIGKLIAKAGQRDALAAILLESTNAMPGCLSYVIAKDSKDQAGIWITEVWDSPASHRASLALPAVQDAIQRAKPLIEGFGERFETIPLGGHGLAGG